VLVVSFDHKLCQVATLEADRIARPEFPDWTRGFLWSASLDARQCVADLLNHGGEVTDRWAFAGFLSPDAFIDVGFGDHRQCSLEKGEYPESLYQTLAHARQKTTAALIVNCL
jgi:hypothetical protein